MGPIFRHTHRKNQPGKERSKGPHLVAGGSDGISIHSWMRLPLEVSLEKKNVCMCTYTVILLCVLTMRKDNCNANNYWLWQCVVMLIIYIYIFLKGFKGRFTHVYCYLYLQRSQAKNPPGPSATKSRHCRCTRHICGHACSNKRNYGAMMCNAQEVRPHSKETWG